MGVQIAIQECKEGKFRDGVILYGMTDDPSWVPHPFMTGDRKLASLEPGFETRKGSDQEIGTFIRQYRCTDFMDRLQPNAEGFQVSQQQQQGQRSHTGPFGTKGEVFHPGGDVGGNGKSGDSRQGKQGGDDEIVSEGRDDPAQYSGDAHQYETEIVIIDVATGIPGVEGWEDFTAQHPIEVGAIHHLFTAKNRVPQVRIAEADEQAEQEKCEEEQLDRCPSFPVCFEVVCEVLLLFPEQGNAGRHSEEEQGPQSALIPDRQLGAGEQPGRPTEKNQTGNFGQSIATIGKVGKGVQ